MDWYWDSVANFLKVDKRTRVVAPAEMHPHHPLLAAYGNAGPEEAATIDALALHKGLYRQLAQDFLRPALERLTPGFANEVFIVLTDGGKLPSDNPHIGDLVGIWAWAHSPDATERPLKREGRMAATYLGNGQVLCETVFGDMMVLAADDRSITPCLLRDGYFDPGLTRFLTRVLRPGMTFVDIGANMGVYALVAARAVGTHGRVLAVEANPELVGILQTNFLINGVAGYCHVAATAVAGEAGERVLHCFPNMKGSSTFLQHVADSSREWWNEVAVAVTVPARTLPTILDEAGIERPDWIKIDIEGAEMEVLRGGLERLKAQRPRLIVEWNPGAIRGQEEEFIHLLTVELGYTLKRIMSEGHVQPVRAEELRWHEHFDLAAYPA